MKLEKQNSQQSGQQFLDTDIRNIDIQTNEKQNKDLEIDCGLSVQKSVKTAATSPRRSMKTADIKKRPIWGASVVNL